MSKLTKNIPTPFKEKLTSRVDVPFILTFRRKLHNQYRFVDLSKNDLKNLQSFFDLAGECSVTQMDKRYRRKTDSTDTLDGLQVIHYGANTPLRIHGVYINQRFEVVRIDAKHKKHK
ncbi:MAG: MAG6450 family protein [Oscillospiraceae bacterium]